MFERFREFMNCRKGNIAMLTAGIVLPLIGLIAGGIELTEYTKMKTSMQHSADIAVMAAFDEPKLSWGKRTKRADGFFLTNFQYPHRVGRITRKLSGKQKKNRVVMNYRASTKLDSLFGELNPFTENEIVVNATAEYIAGSSRPPRLIASQGTGQRSR